MSLHEPLLPGVDARFVLDPFEPAYLQKQVRDSLPERVEAARRELEDCCACPRECHANRLLGTSCLCRTGRYACVVSAFAHRGEEDCLRGWRGSGTIFFSGCNLRCVFCQNWDISQLPAGEPCRPEQIAQFMLGLQHQGCHNINLVTPEHVVPQVLEALAVAIEKGLSLPIVYNTSAYDSLVSLRRLDGLVDLYMPDFKFWRRETAKRLTKAPDYPDRAREAILEMHRQVGPLKMSPRGLARRGLLVRHLVMPGQLEESRSIFRWLADAVSPDTFVNIMAQYHPDHEVGQPAADGERFPEINRRPQREELVAAYQAAHDAGLWRFDERCP